MPDTAETTDRPSRPSLSPNPTPTPTPSINDSPQRDLGVLRGDQPDQADQADQRGNRIGLPPLSLGELCSLRDFLEAVQSLVDDGIFGMQYPYIWLTEKGKEEARIWREEDAAEIVEAAKADKAAEEDNAAKAEPEAEVDKAGTRKREGGGGG